MTPSLLYALRRRAETLRAIVREASNTLAFAMPDSEFGKLSAKWRAIADEPLPGMAPRASPTTRSPSSSRTSSASRCRTA